MSPSNGSNCPDSLKPCNVEHGNPMNSWPIWVSVLCGLVLISIIMGLYHRWKKRCRSKVRNGVPLPSSTSLSRSIVVQPLPGADENLFYSNLDQYLTAKSPDEKRLFDRQLFSSNTLLIPNANDKLLPYTEHPFRPGETKDDDKTKPDWPQTRGDEDDLKKILRVIEPMRPAYLVPSMTFQSAREQHRDESVLHI